MRLTITSSKWMPSEITRLAFSTVLKSNSEPSGESLLLFLADELCDPASSSCWSEVAGKVLFLKTGLGENEGPECKYPSGSKP